jgi:hypothetical protein
VLTTQTHCKWINNSDCDGFCVKGSCSHAQSHTTYWGPPTYMWRGFKRRSTMQDCVVVQHGEGQTLPQLTFSA